MNLLAEPTLCILSRAHATFEQNSNTNFKSQNSGTNFKSQNSSTTFKSQNSGTNFKSQNSSTNQLISPEVKLIQPLNPNHLRSTFPPSYSHIPIPIGIKDCLFKNSTPPRSS